MSELRWGEVGNRRLALSSRPRLRAVAGFPAQGCCRIVTVQGGSEGALQIGRAVQEAGLAWTWIPVAHGRTPDAEADRVLRRSLPELSGFLDAGEAILVHCSAGIHRTGMLTFALLRWRGLTEAEALGRIAALRAETAAGIRAEHRTWGNRVAEEAAPGAR